MNTTFSIGTGIRNKIGENQYFLVLDYDNCDKLTVVNEIEHLQKTFNLSEAQIVKTNNGFHVYYFYDNELSKEKVLKILSESKAVDPYFVENFKNSGYVITRVAGKYEQKDIYPVDRISGREASLLEKSVGDSLKSLVIGQMNSPIINNNDYKFEISGEGDSEKNITPNEIIQNEDLPNINKETNEKKEQEDETVGYVSEVKLSGENVEIEKEKIEISEVWPKNEEITQARKMWYANPFIPRLISASTDSREVGFIKDQKIQKMIDEYGIKRNKKYSINDFAGARAVFLNNTANRERMEEIFLYNVEKTGTMKNPLAFFKSVASFEMNNADFKEVRKGVNLFDHAGRKQISEYMTKNFADILIGYDIIFDFDCSDANTDTSYKEAKKMRDLLNKMMIPFSLNFSGSKGFHIRVKAENINRVCPEFLEFLKKDAANYRKLFNNLLAFAEKNNIQIDKDLYNGDLRGLIRVEWSIHQATGAVVKPLKDSEFDELEGLTLLKIQEKFKPVNLLKGNFQQKIQRNEFVIRMKVDEMYMSWEELRDCGKYNEKDASGKTEWETVRADIINPIAKELRALSKEDPKKFAEVIAKGEYQGLLVEAPEYINLINGSNFDFSQTRKGNDQALREFVLEMIK